MFMPTFVILCVTCCRLWDTNYNVILVCNLCYKL